MDSYKKACLANRWLLHKDGFEHLSLGGLIFTNEQFYQDLPRVTKKIQQRRMRPTWHSVRHPEEPASQWRDAKPWKKTNDFCGQPAF